MKAKSGRGDPGGSACYVLNAGQRTSQHHRHGRFAQTRRAVEQYMIESITAAKGGLHRNSEHLLELTLTDVVLQTLGP